MSTNCVHCVTAPRTGNDLLCDLCRKRLARDARTLCVLHKIAEYLATIIENAEGSETWHEANVLLADIKELRSMFKHGW